jgi:nucleotide-binding universal stress UspA family protein
MANVATGFAGNGEVAAVTEVPVVAAPPPGDLSTALGAERRAPAPSPASPAITTVAVPHDGSAFAHAALAPAQVLVARLDAELVIVRVTTRGHGPGIIPEPAPQAGSTDAPDARRSLRQTVERVRAKGLRAREMVLVDPGARSSAQAIADALLAGAQAAGAGLIVMATHGRTGVARAVLGSVADAVVAGATVPVLLVPPYFGARGGGGGGGAAQWIGWEAALLNAVRSGAPVEPLRLLAALDGSPDGEASLPLVAALVRALGAAVSLVRVVPSGGASHVPHAGTVSGVGAAAVSLERAAIWLGAAGCRPGSVRTAVRFGRVPELVLDQAARERASILVVAPHARAGVARPQVGGVTAAVLARAALPVLVVRPGVPAR